MNQKEWDKWRDLPGTVEFFKYLGDFRGQIGREVALVVTSGETLRPEWVGRATEECAVYQELEAIEHTTIEEFYKTEIEGAA